MKKPGGRILFALAMVAALALIPGPAPAAQTPPAGLTVAAEPAFDGYFKYGEWLPVWVELENRGSDLEAEVQVRLVGGGGTTVFAVPAQLPTGSRKRIPLYVLPNNFTHELEIRVVKAEETLHSVRVSVYPRPNLNYFVGVIAPEQGALALLSGITLPGQKRPKEIIDLSLADVPDRAEGLRSLDCLILNDVDTSSLSPEQKQALEGWVRQGGRLVVAGGAGAMRTAAGLPASLLPLAAQDVVEVDALPGLAPLAGSQPVRVPGPFVVATGDEVKGLILAEQDGLPLVVERTVGSGAVLFVALDVSTSPFDAWSGATAFWERLIAQGASYPEWLPPDASLRQMRSGPMSYALTNLPAMDLPSVQSLAILLAFYILLVGPVNYLFLRWRKRLQWAWITIPALTLAFTAGTFGLGYALRGTDLILNKVGIVHLQPDGTAVVNTYLGLFSPAQQSYEIEVAGGGLLSPLTQDYNPWGSGGLASGGEMVFVQGDPGVVRGLAVNQWSMQSFATEGIWTEFGRISSDLRIEGDQLAGAVHNETPYKLTDVVVILGSNFVRLGDLAPGQEAKVAFNLHDSLSISVGPPVVYRIFERQMQQPGPSGPPRDVQLRQSILESVLQPGGWSVDPISSRLGGPVQAASLRNVILVGWLDQVPPDVRVAHRKPAEKTTGVVYTSLPYRVPDTGHVTVPPGLIGGTLIKMPTEGGTCGQAGMPAVYIGRGRAVFEFQIPEALRGLQAEELTVVLRTDGGWLQPPGIAVYRWDEETWVELQNQIIGDNVLANAAALVSPGGLIQVRLASEGNVGGCYYVDVGLEGTR